VRETAQVVVDANAIRIFEQEIVDAEQVLGVAKHRLAAVMTERARCAQDIDSLTRTIEDRECQALEALAGSQESLATELAENIAELEQTLKARRGNHDGLEQREKRLRRGLKDAVSRLKYYRQELRAARATAGAQWASRALSGKTGSLGSQMAEAEQTLHRIRARQQETDDHEGALEAIDADLAGTDLEGRIRAAGIRTSTPGAEDVLRRLREKQGLDHQSK
jgi:phage shock protein A